MREVEIPVGVGRADDQVKIRGFRIELGEIDKYLSDHVMVLDNVTLVRRNKDEEQTLVSYIVPDMQKWARWLEQKGLEDDTSGEGIQGRLRRFWPLGDDVKQFLKEKLPSYAIPEVIIPLEKFPLNPNGKKDKPALPFPDAAQLAADTAATKAQEHGLKILTVKLKGPGAGRETALRALQSRGFKILSIKDTTPMPHNGSRPPKKRRV